MGYENPTSAGGNFQHFCIADSTESSFCRTEKINVRNTWTNTLYDGEVQIGVRKKADVDGFLP